MAKFSYVDANIDIATSDVSGDSNTCELSVEIGTSEVTCFEENWDSFVEDIASWSLRVAGFTDMVATGMEAVFFALIGTGEQDMILTPQGTGVGYKYTGKVILTSHAVGGEMKGGCPYAATFQGSGQLSRSAA